MVDVLAAIDVEKVFTESNLRWFVIGAGAAALTVAVLARPRHDPGWLVGCAGPLMALFASGWLEWPQPTAPRLAAAVVVGLLAGHGYEALRGAVPAAPALLLVGAAGVWLGVPENDPVLVVAGAIVGLAIVGRLAAPGVGWGLSVAVAWTVVLGARPSGWSFVGGLLCLAPLAAVGLRASIPGVRGRLPAWPWLVAVGGAVSVAAARWVAVAPDATWIRVGVVAVGAGVAALVSRW